MRGKLAVITPDERRAVNFFWQRNDATYQTVITTSLGLQVLSATRNQSGLELTADGQTYESNVPEQLILELTGWQLPIDQLNHWLIADVREEDGVVSKNDQGVITEFMPTCFVIDKQTCPTPMRVTYSDYRKVNKVSLPHRITLIMGAQTFRLKVSGWN
jgi:outer membrane lipoprotein LolB